ADRRAPRRSRRRPRCRRRPARYAHRARARCSRRDVRATSGDRPARRPRPLDSTVGPAAPDRNHSGVAQTGQRPDGPQSLYRDSRQGVASGADLMTNDSIVERVHAIVNQIAGPGRTPDDAGPDTPLGESGYWLDSVDVLEVLVACEHEFG